MKPSNGPAPQAAAGCPPTPPVLSQTAGRCHGPGPGGKILPAAPLTAHGLGGAARPVRPVHRRVRQEAAARPPGTGGDSSDPIVPGRDTMASPTCPLQRITDACGQQARSACPGSRRRPARRGGGRQGGRSAAAGGQGTDTHRSSPPRPAARGQGEPRSSRDPSVPYPRGYAIPAP